MSQELDKVKEIAKEKLAPAVLETAKAVVIEVAIPYLESKAAASETKIDDFALAFAKQAVIDALNEIKI